MGKTRIEWTDYSINPVKGFCPMACEDNRGKEYCYARRMYKRFKWNPEIRFDELWIPTLANIKQPSRIFVGSTIELFGDWVKYWWLKTIFDWCLWYPQHTFIFLTKQPRNLAKWSPFPPNCWVGVSATNYTMASGARYYLRHLKATVKFLSVEPLLEPLEDRRGCQFEFIGSGISWVIVGQCTPVSPSTIPKREWIYEIIEAADKARIPVFIKDNLKPMFGQIVRQEFPSK